MCESIKKWARSFEEIHPASLRPNPAAAALAVQLLELHTDTLAAYLKDNRILGRVEDPVHLSALHHSFNQFDIVIVGRRATECTHNSLRDVVCTCQRCGVRGICPHTHCLRREPRVTGFSRCDPCHAILLYDASASVG